MFCHANCNEKGMFYLGSSLFQHIRIRLKRSFTGKHGNKLAAWTGIHYNFIPNSNSVNNNVSFVLYLTLFSAYQDIGLKRSVTGKGGIHLAARTGISTHQMFKSKAHD